MLDLPPIVKVRHNTITELELERAFMWYQYRLGTNDAQEILKPEVTDIQAFKILLWDLLLQNTGDFYCFYYKIKNTEHLELCAVSAGKIEAGAYTLLLFECAVDYIMSDEVVQKLTALLQARNFVIV